jgi:hypothetical protein
MLTPIIHSFGGEMTTVSAVATTVRVAAAASAIMAAATLVPPAVAYAGPAAPLPEAALGSTLGGDSVSPCDPELGCAANALAPDTAAGSFFAPNALVGGNAAAPPVTNLPYYWLGSPGNPKFVPLIGIAFPSFGLDFEACFLGAAVHLSPYGTGFIGLGLGC